jgi:hypothetical protein
MKLGTATAKMIPITATTTINSIRVKPRVSLSVSAMTVHTPVVDPIRVFATAMDGERRLMTAD